MPAKQGDRGDTLEELQLEFRGCIVPLPSDKSEKPAKLTREQTRQLAEIIFIMFKKWYAQ